MMPFGSECCKGSKLHVDLFLESCKGSKLHVDLFRTHYHSQWNLKNCTVANIAIKAFLRV